MNSHHSKYTLNRRDYNNIRNWYEQTLKNCPQVSDIKTKNNQKQLSYRITIERIKINEKYGNNNLQVLSKILGNGINIFCSLYSEKVNGYVGRSYNRKGILCLWILKEFTIEMKEDIILYFHITEPSLKLCIQFQIVDNDGNISKLGNCQIKLQKLSSSQRVQFPINSSSTPNVAFAECNVELAAINKITNFLPSQSIIDSNTHLSPLGLVLLKKKKNQLTIPNSIELQIIDLMIIIQNYSDLEGAITQKNPYANFSQEKVNIECKYFYKIGYHNSWMFVNHDDQNPQLKGLSFQQGKLLPSEKSIKKKTYEEEGQLILLVLCQVVYNLKNQAKYLNTSLNFMIGWLPICLCHEETTLVQNYLITRALPPFKLLHLSMSSGFKVKFTVKNTSVKKMKRILTETQNQDFSFETLSMNSILEHSRQNTVKIQKKTIHTVSSAAFNTNQNHIVKIQEDIIDCIRNIQKKIQIRPKIIPKGSPIYIPQPQIDDPIFITNETFKLSDLNLKISSILPHTDFPDSYYIPKRLKGQIYCFRSCLQFKVELDSSTATYGIPITLKGHKDSLISFDGEDPAAFYKIVNSNIIVLIQDDQQYYFYAKGVAKARKMFQNPEGSVLKVQLLSIKDKKFGSLILNFNFRKKSNTKQVKLISPQHILHSLPMKQRLKLRIDTYNNSQSKNITQQLAIQHYKEKNHINFINGIVQDEYNNLDTINYELGTPSFLFVDFTNEDSSQNNMFVIDIDSPHAQIVLDQKQYNRVLEMKNTEGKYPKIKYIPDLKRGYGHYQMKILYQEKIKLLLRYLVMDWTPNKIMPHGFKIFFFRNTIPVTDLRIKLNFTPPIINEVYSIYEVFPQQNTVIKLNLPSELAIYSKNIFPLSKIAKYQSNLILQIILQGQPAIADIILQVSQPNNSKIILLKLHLYKGHTIKLNLGQFYHYVIPTSLQQNSLVRVLSSNPLLAKPSTTLAVMQKWFPPSLQVCCLEPLKQQIIITLINEKDGKLIQQTILKVVCLVSGQTIKLKCQNYVGFRQYLVYENDSCLNIEISLVCQNRCVLLDRKKSEVKRGGKVKVGFQLVQKMQSEAYITIYDQRRIVKAIYQIRCD